MPIVDMADLLRHARAQGYGLGAFHVADLASLRGAMAAGEETQAPLALTVNDGDDLELLMPAVEQLAAHASTAVALHGLVRSRAGVVRAVRAGCNSIELDVQEDWQEAAAAAQACGVTVTLRAADVHDSRLAAAMGDEPPACLSLAYAQEAPARAGDMILAVHGAPDPAAALAGQATLIHQRLPGGSAEAARTVVDETLQTLGARGQSAEALEQCTRWRNVEHLIIYNVAEASAGETDEMISVGQRVLAGLPGVRQVFAGRAVKRDAGYQYCWLIRFAHRAVIDSYRDHPTHVAYADRLFRPRAGDRISIDYEALELGPESEVAALLQRHGFV